MIGMKGSGSTNMPQGQNSNLAALFRNNQATAPGAMPQQQLPQIMAPQRPNIAPPPRPVFQPTAQPVAPGEDLAARRRRDMQDWLVGHSGLRR